MTNDLRERVARSIAKVDFLRDQHSGFIGQNHTFGDDWIGSVHYEMADAAIVEMVEELEAAVAAAYDDAAKIGVFWVNAYYQIEDDKHISDPIRTRTPDDAQAALERVKQEARNEAMREAAELAKYEGEEFAGMREGVMFDRLSKKILALIMEDKNGEPKEPPSHG